MKSIICLSITMLAISCKHSNIDKPNLDKVCNVKDPLTDLDWLEQKSQQTDIIYKALLKEVNTEEEKVIGGFIFPSNYTVYYNCSGDVICAAGGFANAQCESYEELETARIK